MKFSGLHFQMVLVIALICVIVYVFYISKDILIIDNELRSVKDQLQSMQKQMTRPHPVPVKSVAQQKELYEPKLVEKDEEDIEDLDDEKCLEQVQKLMHNISTSEASDTVVIDGEKDKLELMHNISTNEASDKVVVDGEKDKQEDAPRNIDESFNTYTVNELKQLCKDNGLSTRGTKEQLTERLAAIR